MKFQLVAVRLVCACARAYECVLPLPGCGATRGAFPGAFALQVSPTLLQAWLDPGAHQALQAIACTYTDVAAAQQPSKQHAPAAAAVQTGGAEVGHPDAAGTPPPALLGVSVRLHWQELKLELAGHAAVHTYKLGEWWNWPLATSVTILV